MKSGESDLIAYCGHGQEASDSRVRDALPNPDMPNSIGYRGDSHPRFRASDKRPRPFIVAYEPLGLVPYDKARKRLRQDLLVTTDPSSPDDKYPFVILWRSRYRLLSTAHSFDLFSVFKACARILPKAIFARNRTEPISNQRCVAKEHDETIHHQSNTSSVDDLRGLRAWPACHVGDAGRPDLRPGYDSPSMPLTRLTGHSSPSGSARTRELSVLLTNA